MSQRLELSSYGKRLQVVWLAFAFSGTFMSRVLVHTSVSDLLQERLYAMLCLGAVVIGVFAYRRDIKLDVERTAQSTEGTIFRSRWSLPSQILMACLAFGLADAIWEMRQESLWLILVLPLNAMWFFFSYISIVRAKAGQIMIGNNPVVPHQ